ncbi:terminase large subunit [Caulobacter phage Seuss]|uniref:Terminase large subunit n=1 Tax=Caulobacter phage Seuss TaxID=1675601 RepID=A0A0K1LM48_9CAUD|nr:terminase large subunit [Caulobacter phage Seuss]AKU43534.1 terminase large subunit [Caulobacter phage Seuss]
MLYSEWIAQNTKLNGRSFGYEGYEFQQAIVDDMHPELAVIKPSQVGMTEVQVRKFLAFLARNRGTRGIFTFPNEKMFKSNSKTRIKPVVNQSVFNSSAFDAEKPTRAMELYEINGSFAHITGLTEGDATSTPADILFHDELDLSDQVMIGLFQSRLQNSIYKITQLFSTPTFPGFGIELAYNASDMREYMVKCACCGRHQVPRFTMPFLHLPGYKGEGKLDELDQDTVDAINLSETYFKCFHCSKQLDLRNPELREWVAERPSRDAHGYRIRPTSSYKLDPTYIIRQLLKMKRLDQLKGWYNTVLGETFNDGNSKLEADMIAKIMGSPGVPEVGSEVPCALASDMGKTCHLVVGRIDGDVVHPFLFEAVPNGQIKDRIAQLRRKYNIVAGAVDRHPYEITAKEIMDETERVILPVEYRGAEFVNIVKDDYDALDYIQINRTKAIDQVVKLVRNVAMNMTGYGNLKQVVTEHMCDMVRIENPEKLATWEKTTGQDHFMHSLVLLQASIKIAHIVKLSIIQEPKKIILGLIGVPQSKNHQPTQLGQARRREPERLI